MRPFRNHRIVPYSCHLGIQMNVKAVVRLIIMMGGGGGSFGHVYHFDRRTDRYADDERLVLSN
jgi:hypothetical protein